MSLALVIGLFALWSSVFAIGKIPLPFTSPFFITGARMTLAALCLLGYVFLRNKASFSMKKRQWGSLIVLGFFSIYLTNVCELWGLQYLTAAKACFIYSLTPIFAAFLSYLYFREKMTTIKCIGLGIGLLGMLPVLLTQTGSEDLFQAGFLSWPTLAVIGAAFFSVYGFILLRVNLKNTEISPFLANGVSMFFGGMMALTHSFIVDSWSPLPITVGHTTQVFQGIVVMTFLYNIICYNLYGFLLKKYTATFLSFVGLLSPIFASINGWLFLGEPLSWTVFVSTGVVSIGLSTLYYAELRQGYIQTKQQA